MFPNIWREYQRLSRGYKARGYGQEHKKIRGQGQGQPFRGQTLSRSRTGMLEAKDQGHTSASALKKNRSSKIFFQAISKKRSSKVFFRRSPNEENKKRFLQLFRGFAGVFLYLI